LYLKGLKMSLGTSLITKKSKLKPEYRDIFLTAKYFIEKPTNILNLEEWSTWFNPKHPNNPIEETLVNFLKDEQYDYAGYTIEYWFQHQLQGNYLAPHCDFNHIIRCHQGNDNGAWLHTVDKSRIMSPITIGCYLQTTDLEGGKLAISNHTWFEEPTPMFVDEDQNNRIRAAKVELFTPQVDDVIYFEGSKHYHWIEKVIRGERKSMMINFWPLRQLAI